MVDAGLPAEDEALIELHIDVLGTVDFGAKTLSIDGSLYNSSVLIYSLAGTLAFRLSWGEDPNFVFSLGGFNPHFNTDGLNVPQLSRLSLSIGNGDNPRISANSYFAVTSNSMQFGANRPSVRIRGRIHDHGYLGFDVLFIISPFSFEFDFPAGFDVSYEGVELLGLNVDGAFSGPTPWNFHGDASIRLLFFSVSASVESHLGRQHAGDHPGEAGAAGSLRRARRTPRTGARRCRWELASGVSLARPRPATRRSASTRWER